jgi:2-oxoisovalerate dehydrogenase E1 component
MGELVKSHKIYSIKNTEKQTLEKWYRLLSLGRMIDERAPNYLKQAIGWSYHAPYAGHDGIQLAIGLHFSREHDHLFPYYRDMLTVLAAGLTPLEILLNGISKATDLSSGGRHMSNHFAKPDWNIHNVSSCTGNHTLHAVGVARAMNRYGHKGASISSQGESSLSEGYCYEAINGASREKLPVIFVIQDNGYGISVPKAEQTANEKAADNFMGFQNLKIIHCDGKDIFDSMNAMATAKKIVLEEGIPVILHAMCVRIGAHSNSDNHELYRDEKELQDAKNQDPLEHFKKLLLQQKIFKNEELSDIDSELKKQLLEAHAQALNAPDPDPLTIEQFVTPTPHKSSLYPDGVHQDLSSTPKQFITAINETLKAEFRHNPHTFLWGQDVAYKEKGGIFNVTKGMQQEFGKERIFNAPIAEDFIVGTANGFSRFRKDIRVVIEGAEFADYFWPAMEQFVESSHDYWRSNGKFSPNMVIRLASGGYIGGGIYHSQNIEGTLCTFPGVRVVVPAFADDAAGLLRTAIRSEGITVFLEPKALYNAKWAMTPVPEDFEVPFGKAKIRKTGQHLTLLTYGNTVHFSLEAAMKLEAEGKSVEVIDLRSLLPLDETTILASVMKTNRVLIVHEDKTFAGFGGELAAVIAEKALPYLDAPIRRVGATFTPVGFNRILERAILPNTQKIYQAAKDLIEY